MDSNAALKKINSCYLLDENEAVQNCLSLAGLTSEEKQDINRFAKKLVLHVRSHTDKHSPLDRFISEYDLGTEEGVLLMCLAESLLRVPDSKTADALIIDKLKSADWQSHIGNEDFMVNASTWCLMLTGQLLPEPESSLNGPGEIWQNMIGHLSEPILRNAISVAMKIISDQFVMSDRIEGALKRTRKEGKDYECFSFDMLGEAALTSQDANDYFKAYEYAIKVLGNETDTEKNSISIKLSALSPRFEVNQRQRCLKELTQKLGELALYAKQLNVPITIDAEESERLELTLLVFKQLFESSEFGNWNGLGLAIQAYQKRVLSVIDYLAALAKEKDKVIPLRLVKGAYWDNEIKQAQVNGLENYPVFTRKCNTDISYRAAVQLLKKHKPYFYPQFATHNAQTVAYVKQCFNPFECEFQRLHGMGEALYEALNVDLPKPYACRVYAPVGSYDTLLPYLVRRLLENGANTSFVHRIADDRISIDEVIQDPTELVKQHQGQHRHPNIALAKDLYQGQRLNSQGIHFADRGKEEQLLSEILSHADNQFVAKPVVVDEVTTNKVIDIFNPANQSEKVGTVYFSDEPTIKQAIENADQHWRSWNEISADDRATILEKAAELLYINQSRLMALCIIETGKTIVDAHNEVREAIDFLRFYAAECRRLFDNGSSLPGPVGEANTTAFRARGIFFCISPWNFPIAIYTGQIAAALAAGNAVLAKPAEQSSLTAMCVTRLLYEAGVPKEVLSFLPGDGAEVAGYTLSDERIAGVAFTGSNEVAKSIERALAERAGAVATLIAETGGINAMLVDSSALAEQVVKDVVMSAFNSAGQRCSALRVLYLQEEISEPIIELIKGRLQEMVIGDPLEISTDIGPVIDKEAHSRLLTYLQKAKEKKQFCYQMPLKKEHDEGLFISPSIIGIDSPNDLESEVFGPVLHVMTFRSDQIEHVCDEINQTGYGLTFGIHSRINHRVETICQRMQVGNIYVNRNMIGAVVGSQPFGGCGLSGTGPKAGGQHYLQRFATEQTISINTAAVGGNASLLTTDDSE